MVMYAHSDEGWSECKEIRKAYKKEKPNFEKQSNGCRMGFLCEMGNTYKASGGLLWQAE